MVSRKSYRALFHCWAFDDDTGAPCDSPPVLHIGRRYCDEHKVDLQAAENPFKLMGAWDKQRHDWRESEDSDNA